MSETTAVSDSPEDLEALFDSIVKSNAPGNASAPAAAAEKAAEAIEGSSPAGQSTAESSAEDVLSRVGQLTRTLHESLRALGYDKVIEKTATAIPDARDRLAYVITMTEQAADRTLNATDVIKPLQDDMAQESAALSGQWDDLFAKKLSIEQFKQLVGDTRRFLGAVPKHTATTNAQLMEIMMAQDFQDLTGQVIKKTTEIIHTLEQELLQLLLDNIPQERRQEVSNSLMNGPVVSTAGRSDIVTNQNQVDDLLESLGF